MGSKGHKSDYAILVGLGLLVGVCLLGIMAWSSLRAESNVPGVRTTNSTNVDGTMVASLLFERFGNAVNAWELPLLPENLDDLDVLWVIDPLISLNAVEVAAVEEWVSKGGVLVSTGIPGRLFRGLVDDRHLYGAAVSVRKKANKQGTTADGIPESAGDLPLARGVKQLGWLNDRTIDLEESDAFDALLEDSTGVRVAERDFGRGKAILLADSSFLTNGMIGKHDNAVLATNLVRYSLSQARGERLAYDEYHLGFGHYESGMEALSNMMVTTSPGWAVLALTVAGLLFLLYKGRRFGTRREPGRVRRRSKMEFVQAVGASFRSAGAYRLVWKLIYGDWKRNASRELGLPVTAPAGDLGARLARRSGKAAGAYQNFLTACEQGTQGTLTSRRLADLIDGLAKLEREALNGNRERKQNG